MEFLETIKEFITEYADYFTFISFVLAVIAILLAYWFYKKGKKITSISFEIYTKNFIENGIDKYPNLKIEYGNEILSNFSITEIAVRNTGSESIKKNDIAPNDRLRVSIKKPFKILEYEILFKSNDSIKFLILNVNDEYVFEFDYLNPSDEALIHFIHNGTPDQIVVRGAIIGETKPIEIFNYDNLEVPMLKASIDILDFVSSRRADKFKLVFKSILIILLSSYVYIKDVSSTTFVLIVIFIVFQFYRVVQLLFFVKKKESSISEFKRTKNYQWKK